MTVWDTDSTEEGASMSTERSNLLDELNKVRTGFLLEILIKIIKLLNIIFIYLALHKINKICQV